MASPFSSVASLKNYILKQKYNISKKENFKTHMYEQMQTILKKNVSELYNFLTNVFDIHCKLKLESVRFNPNLQPLAINIYIWI